MTLRLSPGTILGLILCVALYCADSWVGLVIDLSAQPLTACARSAQYVVECSTDAECARLNPTIRF